VKIGDFGLARLIDETSKRAYSTVGRGCYRFMAPELFHPLSQENPYRTFATDIYAFGCLCYEAYTVFSTGKSVMLILQQIYHGQTFFSHISNDAFIPALVMKGERPDRPRASSEGFSRNVSDGLWTLIQQCWHQEASQRPTIHEVVITLRNISNTSSYPAPSSQPTTVSFPEAPPFLMTKIVEGASRGIV
jgi:serine/threonine protein kinase